MTTPSIRVMNLGDLPGADALRAAAGWNQTLADWRRFLELEPEGCFVAIHDERLIGTATTTCYGASLGWIGMLLVDPQQRRCGVGAALLEHCLDYLHARGVGCIKLDATPLGRPLYERFGFQPECSLTRWEANPALPLPSIQNASVFPSTEADFAELVALDARAFGCARGDLLLRVMKDSIRTVVQRADEPTGAGFGSLRQGERAYYLGPVVAQSETVAAMIIRFLLCEVSERPVFWDMLDLNGPAKNLAQALGFKPQRPLLRMFRGANPDNGDPSLQFALIDPAVG